MIRLRPHHLLCMLTYAGNGYSPLFVTNFDTLTRCIATGEETITIVDGPDDVCTPLLCGGDDHCTRARVRDRDGLAADAISSLLGAVIAPGTHIALSAERLAALRAAFAAGTIRMACAGCQWKPLCDSIAEREFVGTRLMESIGPTRQHGTSG